MPPGTVAIAGIRLDAVRASPVFTRLLGRLPGSDALAGAASILLAFDGRDLLLSARGNFSNPPAGFTAVAPGVVIAGPDAWVRAAVAQHRTRQSGAPALLAQVEPLAAAYPVWAAVQGGRTFPLAGNAANLNRLLRGTDHATLAARFANGLELIAAAVCPTDAGAAELEQSLRAMLTLAQAGSRANAEREFPFDAVRLSRREQTVTVSLALPDPAAARLLDSLLPPR